MFYNYFQRTEFSKSHENQEASSKELTNCTSSLATFLRNRRGRRPENTKGKNKNKRPVYMPGADLGRSGHNESKSVVLALAAHILKSEQYREN